MSIQQGQERAFEDSDSQTWGGDLLITLERDFERCQLQRARNKESQRGRENKEVGIKREKKIMKNILGYLKSNAMDLVNLWKKYGFSSIPEMHTSVIVVYKNAKENGHRKSGEHN